MLLCIIFASLIAICVIFTALFSFPTNRQINRLRAEANRLEEIKYEMRHKFEYDSPEYKQAMQEYGKAYDKYLTARELGQDRARIRDWFIGGIIGFTIILAFMGIGILSERSTLAITRDRIHLEETYDSLMYQIDNLAYQDKLNINDQAIFPQITTWNTLIREKQYVLRNPWFNWFNSPVYNEFNTIDYNTIIIESGG